MRWAPALLAALASTWGGCVEPASPADDAVDTEVAPADTDVDTDVDTDAEGVAPVPERLDDFALAVHDVLLVSAFLTAVGQSNAFGLSEDDPACPSRSWDDAGRERLRGDCTTASGVTYGGLLELGPSEHGWSATDWSFDGSFFGQGRLHGRGGVDDEGRLVGELSMQGTMFGVLGASPIEDASFALRVTETERRGWFEGDFGALGHEVALEVDVVSVGPGLGRGFAFATGSLRYAWPGHELFVDLDQVDPASGCPLATLDDGVPEPLCLR